MELLTSELDLALNTNNDFVPRHVIPAKLRPIGVAEDVYLVPYSMSTGKRLDWSFSKTSMLGLRPGSKLRVATGLDNGARATIRGKNKDRHSRISVECVSKSGGCFKECRLLVAWWPAAAFQWRTGQSAAC
mmetsp:Transcript_54022/g.73811  ORF Transcript_54022/g.73811 Transcript_54022/m.73811 type:complete len:131 (+) Transcript_54022:339-731(+)